MAKAKAAAPAAKSTPAAKTTPAAKPKMTKTAFFQALTDATELKKADVQKVYEAMLDLVKKQLGPKGPGEVTLPNLCKLGATHTKADKGGKKIPNPFKPGETMITKPKPARTKLKARGLKTFLEDIAAKK